MCDIAIGGAGFSQPQREGDAGTASGGGAARLESSPEGCEGGRYGRLAEFVDRLRVAPADRASRVQAFRTAIANGTYDLDGCAMFGLSIALDTITGADEHESDS